MPTRTKAAAAAHGRIVLQGEDRDEETILYSWQYYVVSDMGPVNQQPAPASITSNDFTHVLRNRQFALDAKHSRYCTGIPACSFGRDSDLMTLYERD